MESLKICTMVGYFCRKYVIRELKNTEEFGEQVVESKVDKSSPYNGLAEGMYFLDKSSPSKFNFLDFPLLV